MYELHPTYPPDQVERMITERKKKYIMDQLIREDENVPFIYRTTDTQQRMDLRMYDDERRADLTTAIYSIQVKVQYVTSLIDILYY